jgi:hypothetical protein
LGRTLLRDLNAVNSKKVILPKDTLVDEKNVVLLEQNAVDEVWVRSAITCETRHGICAKCYGRDLAKGRKVSSGEAVGVEPDSRVTEYAKQLFPNISFYNSDFISFNVLGINQFDLLVSSEVIEHIEEEQTDAELKVELATRIEFLQDMIKMSEEAGEPQESIDALSAELEVITMLNESI